MKTLLLGLAFLTSAATATCAQTRHEKAVFAGGCFWCMTPPFEKLPGVASVLSGYTDGKGKNPTYEDYGERGFVEAVEITYDPSKVSYSKLLDVFWRQINPTDGGGQFVDRGPQYRPVIYYLNPKQKKLAEKSKEALIQSKKFNAPLMTEIRPAAPFYAAEDYHQDYHKKNPIRYRFYRSRSGRDQYLNKVWGKKE